MTRAALSFLMNWTGLNQIPALWSSQQPTIRNDSIRRSSIDRFSFAYLKELFLSSMMRWISIGKGMSMDNIILHQTAMLRSQIPDGQAKAPDHNHNLAPEMKTGEDRLR